MKYIHQQNEWPNFYWQADELAVLLAKTRFDQGRLLGRMEAQCDSLRDEASMITLTADVLKSCAKSGARVDAGPIREAFARRLGLEGGEGSAHIGAWDGAVDMWLDATQNYSDPLTAACLFRWHAGLLEAGDYSAGRWRTSELKSAPSPARLAAEMDLFLQWFNQPAEIDPVLKAALAYFWFATIHPFEAGNGRIARAISSRALARADESSRRYYSMSAQMAKESEGLLSGGSLDLTDWMRWYLVCMGRAIHSAEYTLTRVLHKSWIWERLKEAPVHDRQRIVINRMLGDFHGYLNTSKYARLAKCSTDTALRDIRNLQQFGVLIKNCSGGRSSSYRLATHHDHSASDSLASGM